MRDLRERLESGRDRLGRVVAEFRDGYVVHLARRGLRRWKLVAAVLAGCLAIGLVGYAIGASKVSDADRAREAGTVAGEQLGDAAGTSQGYASAFKRARGRAFDAGYRDAFRAAYLDAFEQADLAAPDAVTVSGP